jgi:hypothetical protein
LRRYEAADRKTPRGDRGKKMARYQVEVTETFYYYILVETENEKEARKLAISKIDHLGMEYSNDFNEEGSRIALESILPLEEEELRRPVIETEMARLYDLLTKLN